MLSIKDIKRKLRPIKNKVSILKNEFLETSYSIYSHAKYKLRKSSSTTTLYTLRLKGNFPKVYSRTADQTPKNLGIWGKTLFKYYGKADVYLDINAPQILYASEPLKNNNPRWLIHHEPQAYIKLFKYDNLDTLSNYDRVYTCDPDLFNLGHPKFYASPPFVHWHVGKDYDSISQSNYIKKEKDLVCVNSGLLILSGHKKRAHFIKSLLLPENIFEIYGRCNWTDHPQYKGSIKNKWDIYYLSRYVLVIENESHPYYWSEKFSDAILAYATPIYYGCTNISDFFPAGSYYSIDIKSATAATEIQQVIQSDFHEKNINALFEARQLILKKYNLAAFLNEEICNHFKST